MSVDRFKPAGGDRSDVKFMLLFDETADVLALVQVCVMRC